MGRLEERQQRLVMRSHDDGEVVKPLPAGVEGLAFNGVTADGAGRSCCGLGSVGVTSHQPRRQVLLHTSGQPPFSASDVTGSAVTFEGVDQVGHTGERKAVLERADRNAACCRQDTWLDGWKGEVGDCADPTLHVGQKRITQERHCEVGVLLCRSKNGLPLSRNAAVLLDERARVAVRLQGLEQKVKFGVDGIR